MYILTRQPYKGVLFIAVEQIFNLNFLFHNICYADGLNNESKWVHSYNIILKSIYYFKTSEKLFDILINYLMYIVQRLSGRYFFFGNKTVFVHTDFLLLFDLFLIYLWCTKINII